MGIIITSKQPWRRQPQGQVELNTTNPLAEWVIHLASFGSNPSDVVKNKPLVAGYGSPYMGVYKDKHASIHNSDVGWKFNTSVKTSQNMTLWSYGNSPYTYGGGGFGIMLCNAVQNSYMGVYNNKLIGKVNIDNIFGSTIIPIHQDLTITLTHKNGNAQELYLNNNLEGTGSESASITSADYYVGLHNSGTLGWRGGIYLSAIFNKALNQDEIKSLNNNPWQLLRKRKVITYFDSGISLPPDLTSISMSNIITDGARATFHI